LKHPDLQRPHAQTRVLRWTAPVALLAFSLVASGCADDEVHELDAQTTVALVDTAQPTASGSAPSAIAPEDTATRTVAEAIEMRLAFVEDSLAALPAPATPDSAAADSAVAAEATAPEPNYDTGEDPAYAREMGWPVKGPAPLPGSLLPDKRIVCYYGNPNSTRMGALGEYPKDEMLRRLDAEVEKWNAADPEHPVVPCLHMVSVVAQADPGTSGHYRSIMFDEDVNKVYDWAKSRDGIFIVDIQTGTDRVQNLLPRFEWILKNPDVHAAVDPEFMMKDGTKPGAKIGTMDAADINYVTGELARIVRENGLPPKVLILHRFTQGMITNYQDIKLRPEVQIVIDMDGWGAPWLKRDSYEDYVVEEPIQFTGFKLFYHNDTKGGNRLMTPEDLLRLRPVPLYIQYQ
jgi:hypothetical protein